MQKTFRDYWHVLCNMCCENVLTNILRFLGKTTHCPLHRSQYNIIYVVCNCLIQVITSRPENVVVQLSLSTIQLLRNHNILSRSEKSLFHKIFHNSVATVTTHFSNEFRHSMLDNSVFHSCR